MSEHSKNHTHANAAGQKTEESGKKLSINSKAHPTTTTYIQFENKEENTRMVNGRDTDIYLYCITMKKNKEEKNNLKKTKYKL